MMELTKYAKLLLILILMVILVKDIMCYRQLCEKTRMYSHYTENLEETMIGGNIKHLYQKLYEFRDILEQQPTDGEKILQNE